MEACGARYPHVNSSPRAAAMVLALVSAVVLSPLYMEDHRKTESRFESRWSSSGFMLPAVVAGLIVAIKTTTFSSPKNSLLQRRGGEFEPADNCGAAFRIGSSSLGLAGILIMLIFVLSWQSSVQQFFWR